MFYNYEHALKFSNKFSYAHLFWYVSIKGMYLDKSVIGSHLNGSVETLSNLDQRNSYHREEDFQTGATCITINKWRIL